MAKYTGSCHCGAVRFQIDAEIDRVIDCNCSICIKKGIVHVPVEDNQFELTMGKDALSLYQFKSGEAKHWFCKHCGIHPFGRPRANPTRYTINARCLDDYETIAESASVVTFNGQQHPKDRATP